MSKKGVICIETEWDITTKNNRRDINSEPLLQFLSKMYGIPYIYRKVATIEELKYYFKQFRKKEYADNYNMYYFSFHGGTRLVSFESGEFLELADIAEMANGIFEGKFVHFGSCRTMRGSKDKIEEFCASVGAKMVSGFTKDVDGALCAIHDVAFIAEIMKCSQIRTVINHMEKLYGGLQDELGFRSAILK
ncbi:MAG: hypothetical protein IKK35_00010 [Rikenellaceae bacterium]|nr:hypothetical protein [Rikenellaceae bacterium]MBR3800058.1 hypothetical protein [Rikenellaceae bacterium]